jgi:hypothetical protein
MLCPILPANPCIPQDRHPSRFSALSVYPSVYLRKSDQEKGKGEGSVYQRKDGRVVGEYEDANGHKRYLSWTLAISGRKG